MTSQEIEKLAYDIDEWAQRSFPLHLPRMGVLEEVGELTHCFLKRFQRCRGMEDDAKFKEAVADALGDIAIYCLHDMAMSNRAAGCDLRGSLPVNMEMVEEAQGIIADLADCAVWLLQDQDYYVDGKQINEAILNRCGDIARSVGLDFKHIVFATFEHVTTRKGATSPEMASR
jgi:hypothetical protein